MSARATATDGARRKAAATAALLLFAGALLGVAVDRLWLRPGPAQATLLTTHGLASRLNLDSAEEARIRSLLDSIHADVSASAQHGPDSLRSTAQRAHARLESALPPRARSEFREWMHEQHREMMGRMDGARLHGPSAGPEHDRRGH